MGLCIELEKLSRLVTAAIVVSALTLCAVLVGCPPDSGSAGEYTLTISSTGGGAVTSPDEGAFKYPAGTVVQLVASPDEGYQFREWTGDIARIGHRSSASTTITMNGNYSISASFGEEDEEGGPFRS